MGISIGGDNKIEELTDALDALRDSIDKLLASNAELAELKDVVSAVAD